MKKIFALSILALTVFIYSCEKDGNDDNNNNNNNTPMGKFYLEFDHVWGMTNEAFALNTELKHPMTSDTMVFTMLKYYVSNVKLKKTDGTWYNQPESYYIVDASSNAASTLEIKDIPAGDYTELRYTIGVDSARNVSGAQTGALSPSNEMFWSWNSGYIMIKAEGTSPNSSTGSFAFHLGGFAGANNIVTEKSTDFNGVLLKIAPNTAPQVHLYANPARFRHTLGSLANGASTVHMPSENAKTIASDFIDWIRFDHIHN
jgi:hypothetical protein